MSDTPNPAPRHAEPVPAGRHRAAGPVLYPVPFFAGDGSGEIMLAVAYLAGGFPRGADGTCAFCDGDPCAEYSGPDTRIGAYFARNSYASTCPCCDGRPT